jgi:lysophospholipase L1-like esterase
MLKMFLLSTLFAATTAASSSCSKQKEDPSVPDIKTDTTVVVPKPLTGIRYLALGDSYTIGHSVLENERFPNQLAASLAKESIQIAHLRNIARTGWTTDELKTGITAAAIADSTYDMVSLLIGVNNQYRGRSIEVYKTEFTELLNQAVKFAGGKKSRVVVVSIPDYAFTPFGGGSTRISTEIDNFNAANEQITKANGIAYVNITPISREGIKDPLLVASDGLHPSGKQYGRWVSAMMPTVLAFFR